MGDMRVIVALIVVGRLETVLKILEKNQKEFKIRGRNKIIKTTAFL